MIIPIFDAVVYCHQLGITHRDIKLENLLMGEGSTVKISNFGMTSIIDKKRHSMHTTLNGARGLPLFKAPEELDREF
jgi:serine/threonine protein kinase